MAGKQPPPLMKKHSQTDLVSRLKTRKILGVGGEDDDGEVHRSKVRGRGEGGALLEDLGDTGGGGGLWFLFTQHLISAASLGAPSSSSDMSWALGEKFCVCKAQHWFCWEAALEGSRKQLCAPCLWFFITNLVSPSPPVTTFSLVESSRIATGAVLLLVSRVLFILISIYYYYQVGRRPKKV
ncbi:P5I11 protein, partial [Oreotrochilus melanogaster]|nr:P5I11 protein [Oreotrochilus melanogaster]